MKRERFEQLADACLERFIDWLEEFDPDDLDYNASDGVIVMEFADGGRFVLNRQAGASQMWFAAGARAWHFDWSEEPGAWNDDREGEALETVVARAVGEKLEREVAAPS